MADRTPIEWTDATWNPLRGCSRVSQGCVNCYAEVMAARFSGPGQWGEGLAQMVRGPGGTVDHRWTGKVALAEKQLDQPLRWRRPRKIFVNSTSDLFHESVPEGWIDRIFAVMALATQHTFQVLTKRPERMRAYVSSLSDLGGAEIQRRFSEAGRAANVLLGDMPELRRRITSIPLRNVWLGTSADDQATAETRIPHLLATPAAVRFLSAEPLLGPLILDDMCDGWKFYDALRGNWWHDSDPPRIERGKPRLDWVITGGESGPGARPMHPDWARSVRDQCVSAGVPFFFKQWGDWAPGLGFACPDDLPRDGWHHFDPECSMRRVGKKAAGRLLDGRTWDEMPEVAHG